MDEKPETFPKTHDEGEDRTAHRPFGSIRFNKHLYRKFILETRRQFLWSIPVTITVLAGVGYAMIRWNWPSWLGGVILIVPLYITVASGVMFLLDSFDYRKLYGKKKRR